MSANISAAVFATVSALFGSKAVSALSEADGLLLHPRGRPGSKTAEEFVAALTVQANRAANSLGCGSILLGQRSESDEYGDIAFWLGEGEYGEGHENNVVKVLQLQDRMSALSKISREELSSSNSLPSTLRLSALTDEVKALIASLSQLENIHCFRVEHLIDDETLAVYVLLGRWSVEEMEPAWVGLVSVGVWS